MGSETLLDKLTRYRIHNLHVCGPIRKYKVVDLLVNVHNFKHDVIWKQLELAINGAFSVIKCIR